MINKKIFLHKTWSLTTAVDNITGTTGDDTRVQLFVPKSDKIKANEWITIELPLNMSTKNKVGLIIYENINDPGIVKRGLQEFYMDNVYFYKE